MENIQTLKIYLAIKSYFILLNVKTLVLSFGNTENKQYINNKSLANCFYYENNYKNDSVKGEVQTTINTYFLIRKINIKIYETLLKQHSKKNS